MSGGEAKLLGRWGEALVADDLRKRGCTILASGYRSRFGEIDLIAADQNYLCFVEVKLRKSAAFGGAGEFVDRRKQERLRTAAALYLSTHDIDAPARFDVAEVYCSENGAPNVVYLKDAFT